MKRNELIAEMRKIVLAAEGRGLNVEEKAKIAAMEAEVTELDAKTALEARIADLHNFGGQAVENVLRGAVTKEKTEGQVRNEIRSWFNSFGNAETRAVAAMTAGTAANGGNTVQAQMLGEIIRKLRDLNPLWQYARVIPMGTSAINVPVAGTATLATAEGEGDALGDGATQPTINQITLTASKIAHLVTFSRELLDDSEIDIEAYLTEILAEAMSAKEEALMVAGSGGLAVATSVNSINIGTEALGTSSVTATDLFNIFHGINQKYRRNAIWLMNDSTVKAIRLLTDSVAGQFLWQPGLQAGQPDMLLGRPVITSSSMPELATGARAIVFGDFNKFLIGQRQVMEFQRLNELYAANDLVGLRVTERLAYALALAEAFKVGVCA